MKNENLDANRIEAEEVAEEITESELNEQRQIRREKLKKLQEAGRDPFAVETWNIDAYSQYGRKTSICCRSYNGEKRYG